MITNLNRTSSTTFTYKGQHYTCPKKILDTCLERNLIRRLLSKSSLINKPSSACLNKKVRIYFDPPALGAAARIQKNSYEFVSQPILKSQAIAILEACKGKTNDEITVFLSTNLEVDTNFLRKSLT